MAETPMADSYCPRPDAVLCHTHGAFLYKKVLKGPLDQKIDAVRAERKANVPVVLTREEVSKVSQGVPSPLDDLDGDVSPGVCKAGPW